MTKSTRETHRLWCASFFYPSEPMEKRSPNHRKKKTENGNDKSNILAAKCLPHGFGEKILRFLKFPILDSFKATSGFQTCALRNCCHCCSENGMVSCLTGRWGIFLEASRAEKQHGGHKGQGIQAWCLMIDR